MSKELLPVGVRRDGSYYTRIEWYSHEESTPMFGVCNIIDDDLEVNGGTWGAHTGGPADVVVSFFGEEQEVSRVRFYLNVGHVTSVIEEFAKTIRVYASNTEEPRKLKDSEDKITDVPWDLVIECDMKKERGWQEFKFDAPIKAKYIRIELVENYGPPPEHNWIELCEVKFYPE